MSDKKQRPLKRVVIKEELVELTGEYLAALVLNQFIYWSERVNDYDKMLSEEYSRLENEGIKTDEEVQFKNGWIYKSAEEMNEELMVDMTEPTIRKRMTKLVEKKWLQRRRNPKYKQDRTYQYRVDIIQIQKDLLKLGYNLDKYPSIIQKVPYPRDNAKENKNECKENDFVSNTNNFGSNINKNETLPESTTETTTNSNNNNKKPGDKISKLLVDNFQKAFGKKPNDFQKQKLSEFIDKGGDFELLLKTIEYCAIGGHNQTFFFRRLDILMDKGIYKKDDLKKIFRKDNLKTAVGDSNKTEKNKVEDNYKWKDFFIDFDKYKE